MLSLMCNLYAQCKLIARVPAGAFAPPPQVGSAIVHLVPYTEAAFKEKWGIDHGLAEDVLALASKAFAEPRKKMCNMFTRPASPSPYQGEGRVRSCREALLEIGESPDSRPAALSLQKWVELWCLMR